MTPTPEQAGEAAAKALLAAMDRLKADMAGPAATPERETAAGEVAVEAMKQLMGDLTRRLQPPEDA